MSYTMDLRLNRLLLR